MTNNGRTTRVTAHNLYDDQIAAINSAAKDAGMNRSELMRHILDEWLAQQAAEAQIEVER
jgi:hypothetical protein